MTLNSDEAVFGRYIDNMLQNLKSDVYNREELRAQILSSLLEHRKEHLEKKVTSSPLVPRTSSADLSDFPPPEDLDEASIREKAIEIATWDNSYDTLIWLWAESSLELNSGKKPEAETIISVAQRYAAMEKDILKIHWYLAENLLRLQKKKKS